MSAAAKATIRSWQAGDDAFRFVGGEEPDRNQRDTILDWDATDQLHLLSTGLRFADFDSHGDGAVTAADARAELSGGSLVLTLHEAADWTVKLVGAQQLGQGHFYFGV